MDRCDGMNELTNMVVQTDQRVSRFQLRQMWTRVKNVTRLNAEGVLELKEDRQATGQSIAVLVLATLSLGVGFAVFTAFQGHSLSVYGIIVGGLGNMISFSFSAVVWSITLFIVGTKLFQGKTGYWGLARPLFFSSAPGTLFVLISIPVPVVYISVTIIAAVWVVLSQVFALKQAMGFTIDRTLLTVGVGFLILLFLGLTIQTR